MEDSYFLSCRIPEEYKEIALGIFYGFGMLGCEEENTGNEVLFKCYYGDEENAGKAGNRIFELLHGVVVNTGRVVQQDWNAKWRESIPRSAK